MSQNIKRKTSIDLSLVGWYVLLVAIGWLSIYASEYNGETHLSSYDVSTRAGKQLLWIGGASIIILVQLLVNYRVYESFAYILYAIGLIVLVLVLFYGKEVSGSRSWFSIGFVNVQPSEFMKYISLLVLAKFLDKPQFQPNKLRNQIVMLLIMILPAGLTILQGDTGTALIYSSLLLVMYRAYMHPWLILFSTYFILLFIGILFVNQTFILIGLLFIALFVLILIKKNLRYILSTIGITMLSVGFVVGVNFSLKHVLKPYQYKRIQALIHPEADPLGAGWNITQSKIAIGAGGLTGKGYLKGTQTKFDFVPEESTDFIFCTIAEEWGWIGSVVLILIFILFLIRIIQISERQNSRFATFYGYGVAAIFFFHFTINIAMTIGFFPVVGLPLPLLSYGGSSLWSFTILLFTLLKLDRERSEVLPRF